jgi:SAM-dependent methyltransferase
MANPYDLIRYPDTPFVHTHPIALGAFAALFGKPFTPFASSRVLEVGCGEGGNLLSMALAAPGSEFVGVDLAAQPIGLAQEAARGAGLANVSFHVQDIVHMDATLGRFDYIIAHGVYAWTPAPVRTALMRVAGALLTANGLAFISYSVHPGARLREALRDALLFATQGLDDPIEKLRAAKIFLTGQIERWSESDSAERAMITEARRVLKRSLEVLFHDELSAFYEPQLLSDVVAAARQAGLEYLSDSRPEFSVEAFFPSEAFAAERAAAAGDWARFEQLGDIRLMRPFRNSIFCRGGGIDRRLEPRRLRGLWASSPLQALGPPAEAPDSFVFRSGVGVDITTNNAKVAQFLAEIAAAFPAGVSLDAAAEDLELAEQAMRLFVKNVIFVGAAPFPVTAIPGERPTASPLARFQAAQGETTLTTLRHTPVHIEDEPLRLFLTLLDGTRTRDDLAREVATRTGLAPARAAEQAAAALAELARSGLMTA